MGCTYRTFGRRPYCEGTAVDVAEDTRTLTHVCGTAAGAGDNQLVAAPGSGKRLVVSAFVIQNESSIATTLILRDGTDDRWRVEAQSLGDGLTMFFPVGREWRLADNAALQLNLSGANSCGYSVAYWIEEVT